MANGWLIFFGLVWAYIVLLFWLVRSGKMEKWNMSLFIGFILMIRTQRGRKLLDQIAKPKRFWNVFGDFGIILTLGGMVLMTLVMLLTLVVVLRPDSGVEPLSASEILVIPGVNPFVPLWYGIAALIVTLVVHEGGHGVLARANNMKVKSLGLLYAIVPIGAFVEPDEEELVESPRKHRLRVYAAGATVNIVLAGILMFAFAGMVSAAEPVEGVPLFGISPDSAADAAGLKTGDVIVSLDGMAMQGNEDFTRAMEAHVAGDSVALGLRDGREVSATLGNRWDSLDSQAQSIINGLPPKSEGEELTRQQMAARAYCDRWVGNYTDGGECADGLLVLPFLGITHFPIDLLQDSLAEPVGSAGNFLQYVSLPIGEVRGQPVLSFYLPTFFDEPFQGYWIIATLIFWVFWINLMVGLTNILPMLPLDGGHIFRDAVGGLFKRVRPRMDEAHRDQAVRRLATAVSLLIFGAFLLQILGPRFL